MTAHELPEAKSGRQTKSIAERFWAFVNRSDDGCWTWTGKKRGDSDYGAFSLPGGPGSRSKDVRAHRVSWELHYGPIPNGMLVCHKCDNPPCVRPDHLFLGTNRDNIRDAVAKGRHISNFKNHLKTHCPRGHEYTPENTIVNYVGERLCRQCRTALRLERSTATPVGKPSHSHAVSSMGNDLFEISWVDRNRRNHKAVDQATAERFAKRWCIAAAIRAEAAKEAK